MEKIKEHSGVKILNWKSADFSRLKIDQAKVNWYQWLAGKKTVIEQLEVFKEEMVLCIQGIFPSGEGRQGNQSPSSLDDKRWRAR